MRKEDKINEAATELLKALGMDGDRKVMQREYMELMRFAPESSDPDIPFFSETYLYESIGKEDARSVLAYLKTFVEACGIPRDEQHELCCLAGRTQSCEFCWGDGERRRSYGGSDGETCNVCNGNGWRDKE